MDSKALGLALCLCAGLAACATPSEPSDDRIGVRGVAAGAAAGKTGGIHLHPDYAIDAAASERINLLSRRVETAYPNAFTHVELGPDRSVIVGLSEPGIDITPLIPAGLSNVTVRRMALSNRDFERFSDRLRHELAAVGLENVSFGIDMRDGSVEFLTMSKGAELEAAIAAGRITVGDYRVSADEIIPTALHRRDR
ncbi:hypothetical protein [uncultured Algimonas sp.]|uniref:hypothetical protein n=1 Tax=uncultured Algimonas sp. TaxID=1547920 RepID=UPI00262E609F|nr:hypothetical protein [uncultured Algimonas sp.]